jgi:hypothetical protein
LAEADATGGEEGDDEAPLRSRWAFSFSKVPISGTSSTSGFASALKRIRSVRDAGPVIIVPPPLPGVVVLEL